MEFEEAGSSEQKTQQVQRRDDNQNGKCQEENDDSGWPAGSVSTDDYKELIVQMRKSNLLFQQMSSVPLGELTMLLAISRQSERIGAVRVSGLGNAMKLSRPAVSRMLHVLEKKGYIQMKNGEEDQRYVFVSLTDKGQKLLHQEMDYGYHMLEKVRERMGDRCLHDYLHYCGKFHEILSEEIIKLNSK